MAIKRTLRRDGRTKANFISDKALKKIIDLEFRDASGNLKQTVTPHNRQIGLDHTDFRADLIIKGFTLPEGGIKFPDGSIMTTADGGSIKTIADATDGGIDVIDGSGPNVVLRVDASDLNTTTETIHEPNLVSVLVLSGSASLTLPISTLPFTNNTGTVTPSSTDTFTNKSGDISMWTNDSGYTNNLGTVTSVGATDQTIAIGGTATAPELSVDENQLTGIPNSALTNDSITINNVAVALGGSVNTPAGTVTSVAISGADGVDIDSGSPITSSGTIALGLSNIPNTSLANDSINIAGLTVELGAVNTPIDYADLSNKLTGGNGIDITGTVITPDLDVNGTLSAGAGGLSVVNTPGTISGATGVAVGFSFDGSSNQDLNIDFGNSGLGATYNNANVTLNDDGQITGISSGTSGGLGEAMITGWKVGDTDMSSDVAGTAYDIDFTTLGSQDETVTIPWNQNNIIGISSGAAAAITVASNGLYEVTIQLIVTLEQSGQGAAGGFYINLQSSQNTGTPSFANFTGGEGTTNLIEGNPSTREYTMYHMCALEFNGNPAHNRFLKVQTMNFQSGGKNLLTAGGGSQAVTVNIRRMS